MRCRIDCDLKWPQQWLGSFFCIAITCSYLSACGGHELPKQTPVTIAKSPSAQEACQRVSVIGDMGLNGQYISDLANCASEQTAANQDSLQKMTKLINELGPTGIQQLLDFALQPASTTGLTSEKTYPYLTLINYILGRGATDSATASLQTERFDILQSFLLSLDPHHSIEVVREWQNAGVLEPMLNHLSTFLDQISAGQLSFLTRELLVGNRLRNSILPFANGFLSDNQLAPNLEDILKIEKSRSIGDLTSEERRVCFSNWLTPGIAIDSFQTCHELPLDEKTAALTGPDRFRQLRGSLSSDQQEQLNELLVSGLDAYADFNDNERRSLSQRFLLSLDELLGQHSKLTRNITAIFDQINQLQSADLALIKDAAEKLLDPNYDPTLNKLRAKMGESKLVELLADRLENGHTFTSCQDLSMPPIVLSFENTQQNAAVVAEQLNPWLTPHPSCQDLPPLTALIGESLGVRLSFDCTRPQASELPCIELAGNSLNDLTNAEISPALESYDESLTLRFIEASLADVRWKLEQDPHYLFAIGLAHGPISPVELDALNDFIFERLKPAADLERLAAIDRQLIQEPEFSKLKPDFVEHLLWQSLERLNTTSYVFNGLMPSTLPPSDFTAEEKAAQVFSGTYPNGPYEDMLHGHLSSTLLNVYSDENIERLKSEYPQLFSQFIHRMTDASAVFKSPSISNNEADSINPTIAGSNILNFLSFDSKGELSFVDDTTLRPTQPLNPSMGRNDSNMGLWKQYLANSGLITKDLPIELTKSIENWAKAAFQSLFVSQDSWNDALNVPVEGNALMDAEFFEATPYEPNELRIIASYALQYYSKSPKVVPKAATYSGSEKINKDEPIKGFFNASYLSTPYEPVKPWSVYNSLFPDALLKENNYSNLRNVLLPAYETFASDPSTLFKVQGYGYRRKLSDFAPSKFSEPHKLWSTLSLLSFTQSQSASYPQPLIGVGKTVCKSNSDSKQPIACPIELGDGSDLKKDYENLKQALALNLDQIFCPLLASDRFGDPDQWQARLDLYIKDSPENNTYACDLNLNENWSLYQWPDQFRYPDWIMARVLTDVVSFGKNPQMHPSLEKLPSLIRFSKIKQRSKENLASSAGLRSLLFELPMNWGAFETARKRLKERQAAGFESDQPGLLMRYLNLVESFINPALYEAYLIKLATTDQQGTTREPVIEILNRFIETQEKLAAENANGISVVVELLRQLASDPFLSDATVHMITHTASTQSYDFFGRDLPLAIQGLFGTQFDWNDRGLFLVKSLVSRENFVASGRLRSIFANNEWSSLLTWLNETTQNWGSSQQIAYILNELSELIVKQAGVLTTNGEESFAADNWQKLLKRFSHHQFKKQEVDGWFNIWNDYRTDFPGLGDWGTGNLRALIQPTLSFVWSTLPDMLSLHFSAKTSSQSEETYWSDLILEFSQPLQNSSEESLQSAYNFIADPAFGLTETGLWESLLRAQKGRQLLDQSISVIAKVDHNTWVTGLEQTGDLLQSAQKMLAFFNQKAEWKNPENDENLRQTLKILESYSYRDLDLFEKQMSLIRHWFDGEASQVRIP